MSPEADRFGLQCAIVSTNPNILMLAIDNGITGYKKFSDGTLSIEHLSDIVGPQGHILVNPWWYMVGVPAWDERLDAIAAIARRPGAARFHFLCNCEDEVALVHGKGFDAIVVNHNTFSHEAIFNVIKTEKIYSAVYNAKIAPFKRHELAAQIDSLALIYSRFGDMESYFPHVRNILPKAHFLNGDPRAATYTIFTPRQVAEILNQARVGLCLSKEEGAMYASIEYLLCGLAVVSTRNTGGRDVFFDDRFTRTVEDTPEAVAAAVEELTALDIPPAFIREETLKKINASRDRFVAYIDGLRVAAGQPTNGRADLDRVMSGPWTCWSFMTIGRIASIFAGN